MALLVSVRLQSVMVCLLSASARLWTSTLMLPCRSHAQLVLRFCLCLVSVSFVSSMSRSCLINVSSAFSSNVSSTSRQRLVNVSSTFCQCSSRDVLSAVNVLSLFRPRLADRTRILTTFCGTSFGTPFHCLSPCVIVECRQHTHTPHLCGVKFD